MAEYKLLPCGGIRVYTRAGDSAADLRSVAKLWAEVSLAELDTELNSARWGDNEGEREIASIRAKWRLGIVEHATEFAKHAPEKDSLRRYASDLPATAGGNDVSSNSTGRLLEGYASRFYSKSEPGTEYRLGPKVVERIHPRAFDSALRQPDVMGLFNHAPDNLLGRTSAGTMRLLVDSKGLKYIIGLPNSPLGENIRESLRRRDLNGSSFSFQVRQQSVTIEGRNTIRTIEDLHLIDVGPVSMPAYSATSSALV